MTIRLKPSNMEWTSNKLADALKNWSGNREQLWAAANILQDQAQEIDSLKKQINQLSVYRKPRIGDRVILLDDESEGVIERVSIANGPRISFDDGCYGNYTLVELITLFAYKESE